MELPLPESAFVNKFIAKTQFYNRAKLSAKLQNAFVNKIQKITWKYKLAEDTIGISKTESITEIQIFEIELKEQVIPQNVLKVIDKAIPYPILYIFIYQDHFVYGITLKENATTKNYYYSEWDQYLDFDFSGLDLEKVYHKLVRTFITSEAQTQGSFKDIIALDDKIRTLKNDIALLENKIKRELQFNRKVDLNKILLAKKKHLQAVKEDAQ
jgi:hypothetical protein